MCVCIRIVVFNPFQNKECHRIIEYMHTVHHQSQPFLGAAHQEIPGAPPCWPHPAPASCPSAARSGRWPTSSLACQVQAVATLRPWGFFGSKIDKSI